MKASRLATLAVGIAASTLSANVAHALSNGPPPVCHCAKNVCTTAPAFVNSAIKGDLVFKAAPTAASCVNSTSISCILATVFGLAHTHVGMMEDNVNVLHNTIAFGALTGNVDEPDEGSKIVDWVFNDANAQVGQVHIDPGTLRGSNDPGLHSGIYTSEADPDGGMYWMGETVSLVQAKDEGASRTRAMKAATTMNNQGGSAGTLYGFFGYSDYTTALTRDGASTCAGSVFNAWSTVEPNGTSGFKLSNSGYWPPGSTYSGYSPTWRSNAAMNLYPIVKSIVLNYASVTMKEGATNSEVIAETVAFQFVNAMAKGVWSDWNDALWYPDQMSWGSSISADDLLNEIKANAAQSAYSGVEQAVKTTTGQVTCGPQTVIQACPCSS